MDLYIHLLSTDKGALEAAAFRMAPQRQLPCIFVHVPGSHLLSLTGPASPDFEAHLLLFSNRHVSAAGTCMDHLPSPASPTFEWPRVPLLCAIPFDGFDDSFLDFTAGNPVPGTHVMPILESHLQDLYFRMLHEVLGAEFKAQVYVRDDEQGTSLHTASLLGDLEAWMAQAENWAAEEKSARLAHLVKCLSTFEEAIIRLMHDTYASFNRGIRLSLAALGETLSMAVRLALDPRNEATMAAAWRSVFITKWDTETRQLMCENGWCPNEVESAFASLHTLSAAAYLSRQSRPRFDLNHDNCSKDKCKTITIGDDYEPRHVEGCECELLGPALEEVVSCLRDRTYPVLLITGDTVNNVGVKVIPYQADRPEIAYVALSHVWADGLGNYEAIKLPRCQLLRIRDLVHGLRSRRSWTKDGPGQTEQRQLLIWCDTLCCPIEPNLKSLALDKMREVYVNAAYVLVLDSLLTSFDFGVAPIDPVEGGMRLFASRWMGRLWTLQEAILAKNLLFQFKNKPVDLRDLTEAADHAYGTSLRWYAIGREISIFSKMLRSFYNAAPGSDGARLGNAAEVIRLRRVSVPTDEPLCLTVLLHLNMSQMAAVEASDRMRIFWEMMSQATGGIPTNIIFNPLPRFQLDGFHWAPTTLIQDYGSQRALSLPEDRDHPITPGALSETGLLVRYPAWRLELPVFPDGIPTNIWPLDSVQDNLQLRHSDGDLYKLQMAPQSIAPPASRNLWNTVAELQKENTVLLILQALPQSRSARFSHTIDGLLAFRSNSDQGRPEVRSLAVLRVTLVPPAEAKLWRATSRLGDDLRCELSDITASSQETGLNPQSLSSRPFELASAAMADTELKSALDLTIRPPANPHFAVVLWILIACYRRYIEVSETYDEGSQWVVG